MLVRMPGGYANDFVGYGMDRIGSINKLILIDELTCPPTIFRAGGNP